jgi:hypothetical protein
MKRPTGKWTPPGERGPRRPMPNPFAAAGDSQRPACPAADYSASQSPSVRCYALNGIAWYCSDASAGTMAEDQQHNHDEGSPPPATESLGGNTPCYARSSSLDQTRTMDLPRFSPASIRTKAAGASSRRGDTSSRYRSCPEFTHSAISSAISSARS